MLTATASSTTNSRRRSSRRSSVYRGNWVTSSGTWSRCRKRRARRDMAAQCGIRRVGSVLRKGLINSKDMKVCIKGLQPRSILLSAAQLEEGAKKADSPCLASPAGRNDKIKERLTARLKACSSRSPTAISAATTVAVRPNRVGGCPAYRSVVEMTVGACVSLIA